MQNFLQELILNNIFAFILIFTRIGTVISLMPGIGDSFVPLNVRLFFALSISFILTPVLMPYIPVIPKETMPFMMLIISESCIGLFIGLVMKLMLSALNVAGSTASIESSLANATLFDPASNAQGTILEAIYSLTGLTLIMVSDFHHYMITSAVYSYNLFPIDKGLPEIGSMTEVIINIVNTLFRVGIQIAMPFVVVITLLNIGLGLLGRLMPQMQIFFIAIPVQLSLSFIVFIATISLGVMYWLSEYEAVITKTLSM